jgi:EVE domain
MTHWLLVSSQDNFETSRARGFDVAGMKTRRRKSALDVKPGDTVFYYLTNKDDYLPVESFIQQLEYAKRWPAENWTLAFQGNVHKLSDEDYQLIHGLL